MGREVKSGGIGNLQLPSPIVYLLSWNMRGAEASGDEVGVVYIHSELLVYTKHTSKAAQLERYMLACLDSRLWEIQAPMRRRAK